MTRPDDLPGLRHERALRLEVAFGDARFSAYGHEEVVLRAYNEFTERLASARPRAAMPGTHSPAVTGEGGAAAHLADSEGSEPLALFLNKRKHLKSNPQVATGIVTWAKRHQGLKSISVDQLKNLWRNSSRKMPGNLSRDLSQAVRSGWIERLPDGTYATNSYGEQFVDQQTNEN